MTFRALRLAAVSTALCFASVAAAQVPSAEAPAARKISVEFRGSLRDALRAIAQKGGLNLVVTGPLAEDAEVYLKDVTAEDALRTVAGAYDLKLQQSGSIWTLRAMTPAEVAAAPKVEASAALPQPVAASVPAVAPVDSPVPPPAPGPAVAVPPLPPAPEIKAGMPDDAIERAMREAEVVAARAEREADAALERAEALASSVRDDVSEGADRVRTQAEEMRERAQEWRERAEEARERSVDARDQAREALRSAKKMAQQRVGFTGPVLVKEGEVVEEAVAYGGPLTIEGHVEGDAVSFGGPLTLGPKAWVEGDVVSFGGAIQRAQGAVVEGEVQSFGGGTLAVAVKDGAKHSLRNERLSSRADFRGERSNPVASFLAWFAVLFGLGFAGTLLAPARMRAIQDELRKAPVKAGASGLLGAIALVPLTILLCVTIIGIPVAFLIMWPLAMLGAALGLTLVASELGTRLPLFRGKRTQALVLAVGLLALLLAAQIPVLGVLVVIAAALAGFGAVVRTRFGARGQTPGAFDTIDMPGATPA